VTEGTSRTAGPLRIVAVSVALSLLLAPAPAGDRQQAGVAPDTASITPAMINTGRALFHGRGTCFACHGAKLEGTPVAPALIKTVWKDAKDGELGNIYLVITRGVPGTVMVALPGGINRTDAATVASFIWSVNHRGAKP
jgi:mono/diheme cytochrome c family protein